MRQIKFRAWDLETNEMSYDFLENNWLRVCINSPYVKIMQYTGLKDWNGVDIYEGDIYSAVSTSRLVGLVLYKKGRVVISTENENDYPITLYDGQVIGNIYENPELLRGDIE